MPYPGTSDVCVGEIEFFKFAHVPEICQTSIGNLRSVEFDYLEGRRALKILECGIGGTRLVQADEFEIREPLEICQSGVGDLRWFRIVMPEAHHAIAEADPLQVGQTLKVFQLGVGDRQSRERDASHAGEVIDPYRVDCLLHPPGCIVPSVNDHPSPALLQCCHRPELPPRKM